MSAVVPEGMPESAFHVVPLFKYRPMNDDEVCPVAQHFADEAAQAIALNEVGVVPLLLVYASQVPLESWRICGPAAEQCDVHPVSAVPIAAQNVVLSQATWVRAVTVTPDCSVQDVHVVPGEADPLFEKMVAPEDVFPIT